MSIENRARNQYRRSLPPSGIYTGRITSLKDTTRMGSIEVAIERGLPNNANLEGETCPVRYVSPYYGVTNSFYEGTDPRKFEDVQKSYGFWMVPPDIGTRILVVFIDGHPTGYWLGCLMDEFQNFMIPGLAASQDVYLTPEQQLKYGTKNLPVAEFLHRNKKDIVDPDSQFKPVHPFADRLLAQGLLLDNIRGVTSSSARREIPSKVFGISTPGPLDPNGRKALVGKEQKVSVPITRLGGSQFVMDDGDENGQNELVRIRTRTGHQILLHNSSDLIYIANSQGTAWIELTSNGKIDVYAQDSVSIHSEADFNFRAKRDINLEAVRNINIKSYNDINVNVENDYNLLVNNDGKLFFAGKSDTTVNNSYKLTVGADIEQFANDKIFLTANNGVDLLAEGSIKLNSGADFHFGASGNSYTTAAQIHLNGPPAAEADSAGVAAKPEPLPMFSLPYRTNDVGWINGNFYKAGNISSIMQRVPTHEPWDQHENINPEKFSTDATDVFISTTEAARNGSVPVANDPPPPPNGDQPAEWSKDTDFIEKVKEVSKSLGCNYVDLLACMSFETGRTFDPAKRNGIGATGLIQFIRPVAVELGTTTDYLATLTRTQQMVWVEKYFKRGPIRRISSPNLEDLYMAILWPVAVGKPNDYVIFRAGTKAYSQNAGLDIGKKGYITKEDSATKVRQHLPYVQQQLANAGIT
jgi:hypothetical protein